MRRLGGGGGRGGEEARVGGRDGRGAEPAPLVDLEPRRGERHLEEAAARGHSCGCRAFFWGKTGLRKQQQSHR